MDQPFIQGISTREASVRIGAFKFGKMGPFMKACGPKTPLQALGD